jgi:hypothetical protein
MVWIGEMQAKKKPRNEHPRPASVGFYKEVLENKNKLKMIYYYDNKALPCHSILLEHLTTRNTIYTILSFRL